MWSNINNIYIFNCRELKLIIDETSTKKGLVDAVSAAFDAYKAEQTRLKFSKKLEKAAKIIQANEQTVVECSQLFFDNVSTHPMFENITLIVNQLLDPVKLIFVLDGTDVKSATQLP